MSEPLKRRLSDLKDLANKPTLNDTEKKRLEILALRAQIAGLERLISGLDKENDKEELDSLQGQLNVALSELVGMTERADLSFADGDAVLSKPNETSVQPRDRITELLHIKDLDRLRETFSEKHLQIKEKIEEVSKDIIKAPTGHQKEELIKYTLELEDLQNILSSYSYSNFNDVTDNTAISDINRSLRTLIRNIRETLFLTKKILNENGTATLVNRFYTLVTMTKKQLNKGGVPSVSLKEMIKNLFRDFKNLSSDFQNYFESSNKEYFELLRNVSIENTDPTENSLVERANDLLDILAEDIYRRLRGKEMSPQLKEEIDNFIKNNPKSEQKDELLESIFQAIDQAKAEKDIEYREGQSDLVRNVISKLKFLGIDPDEFKEQILNLFTRQKPVLEAQNNEGGKEGVSTIDKIKFILEKLENIKNSGRQPTAQDLTEEEMKIINSQRRNYLTYKKAIERRDTVSRDESIRQGVDKIYQVIKDIFNILNLEELDIFQPEIIDFYKTWYRPIKDTLQEEGVLTLENINGNFDYTIEEIKTRFPKSFRIIDSFIKDGGIFEHGKPFSLMPEFESFGTVSAKSEIENYFINFFIAMIETKLSKTTKDENVANKNLKNYQTTKIEQIVSNSKNKKQQDALSTAPQQVSVLKNDTLETTKPTSLLGNKQKSLNSGLNAIEGLFSGTKKSDHKSTAQESDIKPQSYESRKRGGEQMVSAEILKKYFFGENKFDAQKAGKVVEVVKRWAKLGGRDDLYYDLVESAPENNKEGFFQKKAEDYKMWKSQIDSFIEENIHRPTKNSDSKQGYYKITAKKWVHYVSANCKHGEIYGGRIYLNPDDTKVIPVFEGIIGILEKSGVGFEIKTSEVSTAGQGLEEDKKQGLDKINQSRRDKIVLYFSDKDAETVLSSIVQYTGSVKMNRKNEFLFEQTLKNSEGRQIPWMAFATNSDRVVKPKKEGSVEKLYTFNRVQARIIMDCLEKITSVFSGDNFNGSERIPDKKLKKIREMLKKRSSYKEDDCVNRDISTREIIKYLYENFREYFSVDQFLAGNITVLYGIVCKRYGIDPDNTALAADYRNQPIEKEERPDNSEIESYSNTIKILKQVLRLKEKRWVDNMDIVGNLGKIYKKNRPEITHMITEIRKYADSKENSGGNVPQFILDIIGNNNIGDIRTWAKEACDFLDYVWRTIQQPPTEDRMVTKKLTTISEKPEAPSGFKKNQDQNIIEIILFDAEKMNLDNKLIYNLDKNEYFKDAAMETIEDIEKFTQLAQGKKIIILKKIIGLAINKAEDAERAFEAIHSSFYIRTFGRSKAKEINEKKKALIDVLKKLNN